jgi:uncharacterized damage-inducible protein DinB
MSRLETFLKELKQETETTRKMLSRVPNDKYDWKPHEKSMNIRTLSTHIAELPSWIEMALTTDELDFAANPYNPDVINETSHLLDYLERNFEKGVKALENAKNATLDENWTLRNGNDIYSVSSKAEVIRMSLSQIIHHRAQLGVYLRLLNIPIPGSYGPSADDMSF